MTRDDLLEELAAVAQAIATHEADLDDLYRRRLTLFKAARRYRPPMLHRVLGEAAGGITEDAVIAVLRRGVRQRRTPAKRGTS